jgi:hypothetical protein
MYSFVVVCCYISKGVRASKKITRMIDGSTGDHTRNHEASHLCAGVSRVVKQLVGIAIEEVRGLIVADEQIGSAACSTDVSNRKAPKESAL